MSCWNVPEALRLLKLKSNGCHSKKKKSLSRVATTQLLRWLLWAGLRNLSCRFLFAASTVPTWILKCQNKNTKGDDRQFQKLGQSPGPLDWAKWSAWMWRMADPYLTGIRVQQAQPAVFSVHWPRRDSGQVVNTSLFVFSYSTLNIIDLYDVLTQSVRIQTGNSCGTMWRKTKWFSNLTLWFLECLYPTKNFFSCVILRHLRGGGSAPTAMQVTAIASAANAKTAALPVLAQNTDPFGAWLALPTMPLWT